MSLPASRFPWLAVAVAVTLLLLSPPARADDYYLRPDFGTDYDGQNWVDSEIPFTADGSVRRTGPPGPGDNAAVGGAFTLTVTSGAVANLSISFGVVFDLSGTYSATTFNDVDGVLSGGGTLTTQTVDSAHVQGGNLVATTATDGATIQGGTFTTNTLTGIALNVSTGGSAKVASALTGTRVSVNSGSTASLLSITNGMDQSIFVDGAGSTLSTSSFVNVSGATVAATNGGTLAIGGDLTAGGSTDADGDVIGNGGGGTGAGTFVSVAGVTTFGGTAAGPGTFSFSLTGGAVMSTHGVILGNDAGTEGDIIMSDAGTVWNVASGLAVGFNGTGNLTLGTGAQMLISGSSSGLGLGVGIDAGSRGDVALDGTGTLIDSRQGQVSVGATAGGNGHVGLADGASLLVGQNTSVGDAGNGSVYLQSGSQLTVTATKAPAAFNVGNQNGGSGTLGVDGSGSLIDARSATVSVGTAAGSNGFVAVTGGASLLLGQNLPNASTAINVGDAGTGTLNVGGGGSVTVAGPSANALVGFAVGEAKGSTGTVTVSDAGSQFLSGRGNGTGMFVGDKGSGAFNVQNGAAAQTEIIVLGNVVGSAGAITVDGSGSTWTNADNLFVGGRPKGQPGGTGTLTVTNAGQMHATNFAKSQLYISPTGTVTVDATGQVAVGTGAYGAPGTLRVSADGRLTGKGKVQAQVVVARGGVFQPGGDPGTFTVQGDYDQTDGGAGGGEVDFQVGGAGAAGTDYDQLVVSGTATLGGTLRLVLLPGYVPKVGDTFAFVQAATVAGGFAQVVAPGLTLNPMPAGNKLTVAVTGVTPMSPPAVTSVLTATAAIGEPFTYQVATTNSPGGYTATGLPDDLEIDPATGLITGTPETAGTYNVTLTATNTGGTGTAALVLTVGDATPPTPGAPVITSAAGAAGTVGAAFSYQITASNAPTGFAASGLPAGLSLDPASGLISGTPTAAGVFTVSLAATNASGTATASLGLTITATAATPPVVTVMAAGGGSVVEGAKAKVFFQRTGDTGAALAVHYKVKGSAQAGTDYKALTGTVTIPAGVSRIKIKLKTLADPAADSVRVAKVKLVPSTDGSYTLGSPATAKLKIIDAD